MKTYAGKLWEVQNLEKLDACKPTSGHHHQGEQGSVGGVLPKRKFRVLLEERGGCTKAPLSRERGSQAAAEVLAQSPRIPIQCQNSV